PAARTRGVQPGRHSIAQARVLAADLVVRPRDPAVERSALQALAQVAASLASRIEPTADGAVFLDAEGATHLVASEAGLAPARRGPAGAMLGRAARGEDERPLAPASLAGLVEEMISLEYPLDTLGPLLFVLRGMLERALARLGLEGIGCARLGLTLGLDDRRR